jgi:hypothetical protein
MAAVPSQLGDAVSDAYSQNGSLASYTFAIEGVMAMRSFPWLHFRFTGQGRYVRGVLYTVRLTQLPFFAKAFHKLDLSTLAPSIWPHRFDVTFAGTQGGDDLYRLEDPKDKNLRDAIVRVDPQLGIREVELSYGNGSTVSLFLKCERANRFLLPSSATGQIGASVGKLAVSATFDDYDLLANGSAQTKASNHR